MSKVSLSSPWVSYARLIYALFREDENINIIYDDDNRELKLYVIGADKAEALAQILPTEKELGNVTLKITVIPANNAKTPVDIFSAAFSGNPIVEEIMVDEDPAMFDLVHVIFKNEVVQYFNDCLNDPAGLETTLYEDIAREVFEDPKGVFFNTKSDNVIELWP